MTRTVQQLFDLTGQTALVTGGSRGLGFQIAQALGEAGARVMLSARKANELEHACQQLKSQGIDAHWHAANCADPEDIQALVAASVRTLGQIDILVNNAGAAWVAPAEDYPLEAWDKVMNLNVRGYFLLAQQAANSGMIARRHGSIINVSSVTALGGNPAGMNMIAYNTSKAAVLNFTRALAVEWGKHRIRVNALCPGYFPTKLTEGGIESMGRDRMIEATPLGRLGNDEDLKGVALLLASAAGQHITGQGLVIDGGGSAIVNP